MGLEPKTKNREIKSLLKAMEELDLQEGYIINKDFAGEVKEREKKIIYIPLWKFLLS